jgi:pimeloyl-ACP methyl ester carboxylesterase
MIDKIPFANVADAESRTVYLGPNRVHYVTAGQGKQTLVFVHGWACHLGFWREQVAALSEKARLILIDLPGHGQSDKPQTLYTMDFFTEGVLAVLRAAQVDRAAFIGHSMGGAVICRVHQRAPEKVAALVSVDGLLRRPAGTPAEARALVRPFASWQYLAHAKEFINTFFPVPGTETLRARVTAEMLATPQHVMLGGMLAMFGPSQPDWILEKVDAPVSVINSQSPWWDDNYESYVHSLSAQSDYMLMDGVGHFMMLERPAAFNAILAERLRKHGLIGK